MTVENEIPQNTFTAVGDLAFNIDFYIDSVDNLTVTLNGIVVDPAAYYITLEDMNNINSNGTQIIFYEPVIGNLVITRTTPLEYLTSYNNTLGNINASNLNNDFSRVYRIFQEKDMLLNNVDLDLQNQINTEIQDRIQGDLYSIAYADAILQGGIATAENVFIDASTYANNTLAAVVAYNNNLPLIASSDVYLVCNPTLGDNINAMCTWATGNHVLKNGARLYIQIADGFHEVDTQINVRGSKVLNIQGTSVPTSIQITSITYGFISGNTYAATVGVAVALPANVVPNYTIGVQNAKSLDLGKDAEALNGAHKILTIAPDRLSFTIQFRTYGSSINTAVVITDLDYTANFGLTGSQVIIPKSCLHANNSGWDGNIIEGFINALFYSTVDLKWFGITYNKVLIPVADEHDMLFTSNSNMSTEQVLISGTGDKVIRSTGIGGFYTNKSMFGGGLTGLEGYQGVSGAQALFIRSTFNGISLSALTVSAGTKITCSQCILSGCSTGIRTTYLDSTVSFVTSLITHSAIAAQATKGRISLASDVTISRSTIPISVSQGTIEGNPTQLNSGTPIASNQFGSQGGVWIQTATKIIDPLFNRIGSFTFSDVDFDPILAGGFQDKVFTATGVLTNDLVVYTRNSAGEPAQNIVYSAFVSATNQITLRAHNVGTTTVDKTGFTARFNVIRMS